MNRKPLLDPGVPGRQSHPDSGRFAMTISPRRQAAQAFTLLELLVVIAIISLIAAILFPVFSRVRENARRASCQSNLKQLGLGIIQYVEDYDGTMLSPTFNTSTNCTTDSSRCIYTWRYAIYPYVKNRQVYFCPDQPFSQDWNPDPACCKAGSNDTSKEAGGHASYACNNVHFNPPGWGEDPRPPFLTPGEGVNSWSYPFAGGPIKQSLITKPSETIMLTEWGYGAFPYAANGVQGGASLLDVANDPPSGAMIPDSNGRFNLPGTEDPARGTRHFGGSNYLYCDGHVKWQLPAAVSEANYSSVNNVDNSPWSIN